MKKEYFETIKQELTVLAEASDWETEEVNDSFVIRQQLRVEPLVGHPYVLHIPLCYTQCENEIQIRILN